MSWRKKSRKMLIECSSYTKIPAQLQMQIRVIFANLCDSSPQNSTVRSSQINDIADRVPLKTYLKYRKASPSDAPIFLSAQQAVPENGNNFYLSVIIVNLFLRQSPQLHWKALMEKTRPMEKKLAANQLQLNQLHQNIPDSIIKYSFVKPFRDVLCPITICWHVVRWQTSVD